MEKNDLLKKVNEALANAKSSIEASRNIPALDKAKSLFLGKSGVFSSFLEELKTCLKEDKALFGKIINDAKGEILELIKNKISAINEDEVKHKLESESIDVTMSAIGNDLGSRHPVSMTREFLENIFARRGYVILNGPQFNREIEDDFHNFTALNIPEDHPARAFTDTFYLENSDFLLRSQTSTTQIRALELLGAPLRVISAGSVYRRDFDQNHSPMFHQMEGLVVEEGTTFSDLKSTLYDFLSEFFNVDDLKLRFRPSYFPFTEPSAEVDLECLSCHGKGCALCKGSGWIEVLGAGMVHPNVLKAVNIDAQKYQGFAFGLGIERFTMFRYGIDDMRLLFGNDLRFLEQF